MKITDIRVRKLTQEGKLRAIISITFNDALAVHDIKVIEGKQGLFVAMPSRRGSNGEFRDIIHPINQQSRTMVEGEILQAYHQYVADPRPYAPTDSQVDATLQHVVHPLTEDYQLQSSAVK